MGSACYRVGQETHRIGQGLFGRLEPNEAAGDLLGLGVERNWLDGVVLKYLLDDGTRSPILGSRSRSTSRAARANRSCASRGKR